MNLDGPPLFGESPKKRIFYASLIPNIFQPILGTLGQIWTLLVPLHDRSASVPEVHTELDFNKNSLPKRVSFGHLFNWLIGAKIRVSPENHLATNNTNSHRKLSTLTHDVKLAETRTNRCQRDKATKRFCSFVSIYFWAKSKIKEETNVGSI